MEQVFELMMDQVLAQKDPVARRARREEQENCKKNTPKSSGRLVGAPQSKNPRHVPARVRDEVFVRDRGRCSFVGRTGRKCQSTSGLQVDHVVPVARGGTATPGNLRLLCAYHNRLEAERILGRAAMSRAAHAGASPGQPVSQWE
jgi:5-methylcytosine-specific restriction endonuclease McrA